MGLTTTTSLIPPTTMTMTSTASSIPRNTPNIVPLTTPLITARPDTSTTTTTVRQSLQTTITNNDFQTTEKLLELMPDDVSDTFITSNRATEPSLINILTGNTVDTTTPLLPTFPNFPVADTSEEEETVLLLPDVAVFETTIQSNATTESIPLPLFNDSDFTTASKPTSVEAEKTTEYNSVRDTNTTTEEPPVPEFATTTTATFLAFSDILASNLPTDVLVTPTDTEITTLDTKEEMIQPDFSVYDMDTGGVEVISFPDFEVYDTERESLGNENTATEKQLIPDLEIYDTITESQINQATTAKISKNEDMVEINTSVVDTASQLIPDFEVEDTITDRTNQVKEDTAEPNMFVSDTDSGLIPDLEVVDTITEESNQVSTESTTNVSDTDSKLIPDFEVVDTITEESNRVTIESTTNVSDTDSKLIPDFEVLDTITTEKPIVSGTTTTQEPVSFTNTVTVSNTVDDKLPTVSNTPVTTILQEAADATPETSTVFRNTFEPEIPQVALVDTIRQNTENTLEPEASQVAVSDTIRENTENTLEPDIPQVAISDTIHENTTGSEDQSQVSGTTLGLFLESLFNQLSQSSSVSVPPTDVSQVLLSSLNQTLEKVPDKEEGQAFSSLLFQSLLPLPPPLPT